jgi:hypothetical protein
MKISFAKRITFSPWFLLLAHRHLALYLEHVARLSRSSCADADRDGRGPEPTRQGRHPIIADELPFVLLPSALYVSYLVGGHSRRLQPL